MRWLQNPHHDVKVSSIFPNEPIRKAKTVNIIINTVLGFYDYLMRHYIGFHFQSLCKVPL
ncbi:MULTISPECIES: hypothetical protein [Bacillus cereus group]|uniref:Uncharacterized protein n=1 Tax=Bacillus cereus VD021 TaxID=1053224 RepID=R8HFT7_BACCE|nr:MULTISPECIES: hypothetical protein [Bacillus cereus group]EOO71734.1 hypothetical protein IIC_04250 [Bacillus cereus VD021]MCQ6569159.1 hypothetical protein [Bacillus mycoides]